MLTLSLFSVLVKQNKVVLKVDLSMNWKDHSHGRKTECGFSNGELLPHTRKALPIWGHQTDLQNHFLRLLWLETALLEDLLSPFGRKRNSQRFGGRTFVTLTTSCCSRGWWPHVGKHAGVSSPLRLGSYSLKGQPSKERLGAVNWISKGPSAFSVLDIVLGGHESN